MIGTLHVRRAEPGDAGAIAAIYNQGIAERCATFDTDPRTAADIAPRIAGQAHYPIVVAVEPGEIPGADRVVGWAALGSYRTRPCYASIAEFSIYVDDGARGSGVGRSLLDALITEGRAVGFWKIVGRVFAFNAASRALCRSAGFREVGVYEKHGQLDGRWLDVVIVEKLL
jgi:L-amino acid N-acyltransferase YncA